MFDANITTLYVRDLAISRAFYTRLLGREPVSFSPGFTMFFQESGARIALWAGPDMEPPSGPSGGFELSFFVAAPESVDAAHEQWMAMGIDILKAPWRTPYVYSFVAADPDGHRLRVYWPLTAGGD